MLLSSCLNHLKAVKSTLEIFPLLKVKCLLNCNLNVTKINSNSTFVFFLGSFLSISFMLIVFSINSRIHYTHCIHVALSRTHFSSSQMHFFVENSLETIIENVNETLLHFRHLDSLYRNRCKCYKFNFFLVLGSIFNEENEKVVNKNCHHYLNVYCGEMLGEESGFKFNIYRMFDIF